MILLNHKFALQIFYTAFLLISLFNTINCKNLGTNSAISDISSIFDELPAFSGAEGFGSTTSGGRGGRVIEVINLNEDGTGSFRAACKITGPRIIVFRMGGTLLLDSNITIEDPYITIAGQSAPGDGILIRGAGILIRTHDVIIRGLRIRVGDDSNGPVPSERDGITIANPEDPPYNIIIDHCSISWAVDENVSTWRECNNITFQWSIISEGLNNSIHTDGKHSMGMLLGRNAATNISVHHNLFAHHRGRQPLVQNGATTEVINNIVYNWQNKATDLEGSAHVNLIGNLYKPGADTPTEDGPKRKGVFIQNDKGLSVYVSGNIGPGRPTNTGDDWLITDGDEQYRSLTPAVSPSGITTYPVEQIFDLILANAGAISPTRDAVDVRIVKSVRDGIGRVIDSQDEVGGWPELAHGTPPVDTDHDGMPDAWEKSRGLDPNDARDGGLDRDGDGYTNIEEYLNGLIQ